MLRASGAGRRSPRQVGGALAEAVGEHAAAAFRDIRGARPRAAFTAGCRQRALTERMPRPVVVVGVAGDAFGHGRACGLAREHADPGERDRMARVLVVVFAGGRPPVFAIRWAGMSRYGPGAPRRSAGAAAFRRSRRAAGAGSIRTSSGVRARGRKPRGACPRPSARERDAFLPIRSVQGTVDVGDAVDAAAGRVVVKLQAAACGSVTWAGDRRRRGAADRTRRSADGICQVGRHIESRLRPSGQRQNTRRRRRRGRIGTSPAAGFA